MRCNARRATQRSFFGCERLGGGRWRRDARQRPLVLHELWQILSVGGEELIEHCPSALGAVDQRVIEKDLERLLSIARHRGFDD